MKVSNGLGGEAGIGKSTNGASTSEWDRIETILKQK